MFDGATEIAKGPAQIPEDQPLSLAITARGSGLSWISTFAAVMSPPPSSRPR